MSTKSIKILDQARREIERLNALLANHNIDASNFAFFNTLPAKVASAVRRPNARPAVNTVLANALPESEGLAAFSEIIGGYNVQQLRETAAALVAQIKVEKNAVKQANLFKKLAKAQKAEAILLYRDKDAWSRRYQVDQD